jgi:hypothetical protein
LTILDRIRAFANPPAPTTTEDDGEGYGRASFKSGNAPVFFNSDLTDKVTCRRMYEQGGMVGEAIDAYPLFAWTNGYALEGDAGASTDMVQEFLDGVELETLGHQLIVDALVIPADGGSGKGYAEIVWNRAGNQIVGLQYRPAETFTEILDPRGKVITYRQTIMRDNSKITVDLPPENMLVIDLHMPLIKRAFKDIQVDAAIADATATSIQRHGYPRYHVKLGQPGEAVSLQALRDHGRQFEDLKPNMEWTTTQDVAIDNIDKEGISQALNYTNWSVQRLSAALGVPEEMLGLGRGSTEATANVRLESFYDKIGSIQFRFAQALNKQVIDQLTGKEGSVWLKFNDVSPEDEMRKAEFLAKIIQATPVDPWSIITPEYAREYLGIEIDESELLANAPPPPLPPTIVMPGAQPGTPPKGVVPPQLKDTMLPPKDQVPPEVIQ